MQSSRGNRQPFGWHNLFSVLVLSFALVVGAISVSGQAAQQQAPPAKPVAQSEPAKPKQPESFSAEEFSKLSREFSEEGGTFRSDNFTSNETSYLHVVQKLREAGTTGGAYLGVGPEQNYTYIAKTRPQIVFLFDIRRQAIIQHLMYKAVFHTSENPAQFLAKLLSRPLPAKDAPKEVKDKAPAANASINELLNYFSAAAMDEKAYQANLAEIRKLIQEEFKFPLSDNDKYALEYVYKSFRDEGLAISYRTDGGGGWGGYFPTLREILAGEDLFGKQGNFLAVKEDYEFVRGLHRKNLIIPVVADFAGKKGIASVAEYLKKNGYTVTAFYLSNVEQYLFQNGVFGDFAENVRKLPLTDKSLFIRAIAGRGPHPARQSGHRLTTLLQKMTVFLKDYDEKLYSSYYELSVTNYIAP
ncbi:MAG: hypothetical protein SF097_23570 [Acidobacteriota bacterium]|nr:hypothetical protein [Acidobacteriota bacterium]